MQQVFDTLAEYAFSDKIRTVTMAFVLVLLGFVVFAVCLTYRPSDFDDVILLSSVARVENPLSYFIGDFGYGNNAYRPLQSVLLWLSYRLFGVFAFPNQLFNLLLHLANLFLLLRIVKRIQLDQELVFLIGAVFLVSQHTYSAPAWVSDRATLLAAFFLLLLLDHLVQTGDQSRLPSLTYVVILSVLGLLSKESGLIAVLFVAFYAAKIPLPRAYRLRLLVISSSLVGAYYLSRYFVFSGHFVTFFSQQGHIFLVQYYASFDNLPVYLQPIAIAENIGKALVGLGLPVFTSIGRLYSPTEMLVSFPLWGANAAVALFVFRRRLTSHQVLGVVIVVFNALAHYLLYRHRVEYIAWIGFCILVAGSLVDSDKLKTKLLLKTLLVLLLLSSLVSVTLSLRGMESARLEEIEKYSFSRVFDAGGARIDSSITRAITNRYGKR